MKYLCIHCHFYQPPRENPWLEQIELQDSAYPYHDWNERISAECYAPNLAARILDDQQRITRIVNNYSQNQLQLRSHSAFLGRRARAVDVYKGIIEADRQSQKSFSGHGSAMAQAYNHMIMPLANRRDKRTQIRWGFEDFASRFGRLPEGMWLPETAVDLRITRSHGASRIALRYSGSSPGRSGPAACRRRLAGRQRLANRSQPAPTCSAPPAGEAINLFFYDGPISQAVAFEKLLEQWREICLAIDRRHLSDQRDWPQLIHIATDGETYGHHHRHGEMALAYALEIIETKKLAKITNYGEFLENYPPAWEVQIHENTSWSCVHGVERWRSNCGCNSGRMGWNQEWRKPLREALDWLRDAVAPRFEELGVHAVERSLGCARRLYQRCSESLAGSAPAIWP